MSYVTGTHNIKFGFQNSFGPVHVYTDRQADLVQNYVNNRPQTVTVYTTPSNRFSHGELRPRLLHPGLVDDQAADVEPRSPRGQLQFEDRVDGHAGWPLRGRALLRGAEERADLEQ